MDGILRATEEIQFEAEFQMQDNQSADDYTYVDVTYESQGHSRKRTRSPGHEAQWKSVENTKVLRKRVKRNYADMLKPALQLEESF